MDEKTGLSKSTTIIMGVMFLIMGIVALVVNMNIVGSILLVGIGIIGIVGGMMGTFEEKKGE